MLRKLYDNLEEYLCFLFSAVMVLCLILQVGIRTLTGDALAWTEELSRYCFIWTVYVAMCFATKRLTQVRITAQFLRASVRTRLIFRFIADAICIAFNFFVAWVCFSSIAEIFDFPEISATLGIVKGYVEMVIPVCFVLASWRCIEAWVVNWRRGTLENLVKNAGEGDL